MLSILTLIADATTKPSQPPPQPGIFDYLPMLLLLMFIIYFLMIRPQSKEKKRRTDMLAAIKKNDRVITIGGIIGTVTSVRDDEITLKVDESSNTKITFSRSALQRVLSDTAKESNEPDAAKK
ncbi:MAG: preprotein translocase subunit YajC [Phycisphaerales bacterium]|nr:preprotein translocase subunit YajC [Phycisphaerales bacterium]